LSASSCLPFLHNHPTDPKPSSGGLEIVFDGQRSLKVQLPSSLSSPATIASLITYLTEHYLADSPKKDLFVLDGTVRPGILVLVNDADWELEGEGACELKSGDEVVFVSTLHGG